MTTDGTLERFEQDDYVIRLVHVPRTTDAEEVYQVECGDGADLEIMVCDDYAQAFSFYRTVVRQAFGVNVPFKPLPFEMPEPEPWPERELTAEDLFFAYYAEFQKLGLGSDGVLALSNQMVATPEFRRLAAEIRGYCGNRNSWIKTVIYGACMQVIEEDRNAALAEVSALPNFGRF